GVVVRGALRVGGAGLGLAPADGDDRHVVADQLGVQGLVARGAVGRLVDLDGRAGGERLDDLDVQVDLVLAGGVGGAAADLDHGGLGDAEAVVAVVGGDVGLGERGELHQADRRALAGVPAAVERGEVVRGLASGRVEAGGGVRRGAGPHGGVAVVEVAVHRVVVEAGDVDHVRGEGRGDPGRGGVGEVVPLGLGVVVGGQAGGERLLDLRRGAAGGDGEVVGGALADGQALGLQVRGDLGDGRVGGAEPRGELLDRQVVLVLGGRGVGDLLEEGLQARLVADGEADGDGHLLRRGDVAGAYGVADGADHVAAYRDLRQGRGMGWAGQCDGGY